MSRIFFNLFSKGIFKALQNKNYAIYAPFSFIAAIAYWIQRISIQWLAWELTGSYAWLGAFALCEAIAMISVMPFAGVLVDQINKITLAKITRAVTSIMLFVAGICSYYNILSLPLLLILIIILGISDGFWVPARLTLIPSLVPKKLFSSAIAFEATAFHATQFIGPAVAGILISFYDVHVAFIVSSVLMISIIIALSLIRLTSTGNTANNTTVFARIKDGLSYIYNNKGMLRLLLFATLTGLCLRPYREFYAGFSDQLFNGGAQGLAILASSSGAGAVIATLYIGSLNKTDGLTRNILGMASLGLISMILLSFSPSFTIALFAAAGLGFSLTGFGTCSQILIQNSVEDSKRGRVMSLWGLQLRAIPSIGGFLIGSLASFTGIRTALLLASVIFILLSAILVWPERGQINKLERA